MRNRNTLKFLRQWEIDMNEELDDAASEELIHQGYATSLTIRHLCDFEGFMLLGCV